ncbi:hypothetical protein EB796_014386 [Bugula neritina]|uniref:Uncharacterized protein n=1 Tax=Bugula neritina TaxID=10212 RepID=A0A7J7JLR8_BUGNE|nr:hypothetical protein EB796_014386 [Bugula neritina]
MKWQWNLKGSPLSNWHWGTCFSKGMNMGYTWHAGDHPLDKLSQESQGILTIKLVLVNMPPKKEFNW